MREFLGLNKLLLGLNLRRRPRTELSLQLAQALCDFLGSNLYIPRRVTNK
jgi:hypothetical protein